MDFKEIDLGRVRLSAASAAPEGEPLATVLLIHGFASTARVNWVNTGWVSTLVGAGYRVIAFDNRGHGASQKFYEPTDYGPDIFALDAIALLAHFDIETCHVIGYSMGARITSWLAAHHGERVGRAVLGGMGANIFGNSAGYEPIAEALEAPDPTTIIDPRGATFRKFADATGSDRLALAACIRKSQAQITRDTISAITAPTLVVVGDSDDTAGAGEPLAEMLPNGSAVTLPGLDHMKATGAKGFKDAALRFLST
ncbi:MAG: alpha/beta hydrolase [Pseudomonadota bacterium]